MRIRGDYKPPTTGIKSRLAPRVSAISTRRIVHTGSSRILRRNDLRTGIISKRPSAPVNRAKEYAKKIRQARMKLNEGNSTSSAKAKSEGKSPKGGLDENIEEDFLAIANDVNFDDDDHEHESTGGKVVSKIKVKKDEKEEAASNAGDEGDDVVKKTSSDEPTTSKENVKERRTSRHEKSHSRSLSKDRVRKFDRVEYVCIHCDKHSTSAHVRMRFLFMARTSNFKFNVCV
jgi:hypothetical protein